MNEKLYVVTISHQLGSGGAALGQKLSERLGIPFFDRDILKKVAEELNMTESMLEGREEHLSGFWQSLSRVAILTDPVECLSLQYLEPDDRELFQIESDCIQRIAEQSSAVFFGRLGRYILRNHPRHFNILVHANLPDRVQRVQGLFCLEAAEAKKLIEKNDRERNAYSQTLTKQDWLDARWYDLCVNTSSLGLEKTIEVSLLGIEKKLGLQVSPQS